MMIIRMMMIIITMIMMVIIVMMMMIMMMHLFLVGGSGRKWSRVKRIPSAATAPAVAVNAQVPQVPLDCRDSTRGQRRGQAPLLLSVVPQPIELLIKESLLGHVAKTVLIFERVPFFASGLIDFAVDPGLRQGQRLEALTHPDIVAAVPWKKAKVRERYTLIFEQNETRSV